VKNLEAKVLNTEFSVAKRTESPLSDATVCLIAVSSGFMKSLKQCVRNRLSVPWLSSASLIT